MLSLQNEVETRRKKGGAGNGMAPMNAASGEARLDNEVLAVFLPVLHLSFKVHPQIAGSLGRVPEKVHETHT